MPEDRTKLVIIGAGFCGTLIAKHFDGTSLKVTLIDRKDYFLYKPGLHRGILNPEILRHLKVNLQEIFKEVRTITEEVSRISSREVVVGGEVIQPDILVIAKGANYPLPLEDGGSVYTATTIDEIVAINEKLPSVERVLVAGGGSLGVEVSAELVTQSEIKTILVHSGDRLLPREPSRASRYARGFLEKQGVDLLLDQRVVQRRGGKFLTDRDREIQADICIWCAGISRRGGGVNLALPDSSLEENGALRTDRYLRLVGSENIFVGGDVNALPEEKTAQNAERHAGIIIKNIRRSLEGRDLVPYRNRGDFMVISLGPKRGLATFRKWSLARGWIPSILKKAIRKWTIWKYGR